MPQTPVPLPPSLPAPSLASRLTPGAGLHSARVAWRHSLRFRLSLMYTLGALLITAVIGFGITAYLLGQMNRQFDTRLAERAEAVADRFTSGTQDIGKRLPANNIYTAVLTEDNQVLAASASLQTDTGRDFKFGDEFPYAHHASFDILGVPLRSTTRPVPEYGLVWVALPETDLVVARNSAARALLLSLLVAPLLLLLLGWLVGQRMLAGLGEAAELADRIDPSRSLATLPLPEREDEVHRLLTAINRLLVRIEAGQQREKQLLGQIVHELGAPLTVLKASLSSAGERTGDADVVRAALVADELTFTTQDLMQLARGQLEMKMVWHFIPAQTLQARLDRLVTGVQFEGDWTGGILCDPDRLTQALRNLLANARRHAGLDGLVSCHLEETAEWLTFTVRDSGPGLPPELGERIFDPFVSGAGSSGLGLSVSRQIAVMHGGNLVGGNHFSAGGAVAGAEFLLTVPGAALGEDEDEEGLTEE